MLICIKIQIYENFQMVCLNNIFYFETAIPSSLYKIRLISYFTSILTCSFKFRIKNMCTVNLYKISKVNQNDNGVKI